jgi:hypothetical protein
MSFDQHTAANQRARAQLNKVANRQRREVRRYLKSAPVRFVRSFPATQAEFAAALEVARRGVDPTKVGPLSFARHDLSNYDEILSVARKRFGQSLDPDLVQDFRGRVNELVKRRLAKLEGWDA